jgi:hypothetical protein
VVSAKGEINMWLLGLFFLAICLESGRSGIWMALVAAALWGTSCAFQGDGLIWPWPASRQFPVKDWEDASAETCWTNLVSARRIAEEWALSRWKSASFASAVSWGMIFLSLASMVCFGTFEWDAISGQSPLSSMAAEVSLDIILVMSFAILLLASIGRTRTARSATSVVMDDLQGALPLLRSWRDLCGTAPLPYVFWRYASLGIPALAAIYRHLLENSQTLAITAVFGVAMVYFAYVVLDMAFDTLAVLNGVEVCPCRSRFLARLVWEAQFMSIHYKPVWARWMTGIGI